MASRNSRNTRPVGRSSNSPQSARAARAARAAQSGRIASRGAAEKFSRTEADEPAEPGSYRSAYEAGSQGYSANNAYRRQSAAAQYSRNNPEYANKARKRMSTGKKVAAGVLCALLVAVIGGGSAAALYVSDLNKKLGGNKTEQEMQEINDVLAPTQSFDKPFYMMLIGSDRREGDEASGARSDTNIVVRVDPVNNQATMVSIPRDTKIEIDGYGTNKFNAAYNFGGASAAIREASQLTGAQISHYAEVNFEELVQLVDVVGGVEVMVDERIDDTDADNTTDNPGAPRIIIEEGMQHLDGEEALVFARSRAYVDGDFTRAANQRKLILALVEKVLSLPVTDLPAVIQSAAESVNTDLSVGDIILLAQQFKNAGELTMYSAMVPSTTGYIGDTSYVFTYEPSLKEMMKVVEEGGDPSTVVMPQNAYAENATKNGATVDGLGSGSGYGVSSSSQYSYSQPSYSDTGSGYVEPNYPAPDTSTGSGTGTSTGTGTATSPDAGTGTGGSPGTDTGTNGDPSYDPTYDPNYAAG